MLMRITCDASCSMGYIYLKSPTNLMYDGRKNDTDSCVEGLRLKIPLIKDSFHGRVIQHFRLMDRTYKEALDNGDVDSEYCNDLDEFGYIKGIELNLRKDRFLQMIQSEAVKIFDIQWQGEQFKLVTLDFEERVFDDNNVVYPLSHKKDAYIIVNIEETYKIGLIKALIFKHDGIYSIDYLMIPEFVLTGNA
jgi:hypothetical protein